MMLDNLEISVMIDAHSKEADLSAYQFRPQTELFGWFWGETDAFEKELTWGVLMSLWSFYFAVDLSTRFRKQLPVFTADTNDPLYLSVYVR